MKKIHIIDGSQAGDYYPAEEVEKQLAALTQERDALRLAQAQEVEEFNTGYQAFENGLDMDDAEREYRSVMPAEVPSYDVFRIGYVWAKYIHETVLQAENKP